MTCRNCQHSYRAGALWCLPKCDKPVDPGGTCKRFPDKRQLGLAMEVETPTRASLGPLRGNER